MDINTWQAANGVEIANFKESGWLMTDAEFLLHDLHLQVVAAALPANAAAVPALLVLRPRPAMPANPAAAAGGGTVKIFELNRLKCIEFNTILTSLRKLFLDSVDNDIKEQLKINGSLSGLTVTDFINTIDRLYGTFNASDLLRL
jgi:hypothetical protein